MGGDDDDALYDELYGDDDDAVELPTAPQPKPSGGGFKIPKTAPAPVEDPAPSPPNAEPNAEPKPDDDDSDDDFDIALNEPDVGDPDDPDDFKIVLDDTEALYAPGGDDGEEGYDAEGDAGAEEGQETAAQPTLQNVPPPPPTKQDIRHNSKTYVRGAPPPPARHARTCLLYTSPSPRD